MMTCHRLAIPKKKHAKTCFLHYTAAALFDETIRNKMSRTKFVSVLCYGFTDASIVEKKVTLITSVDPDTFKPSVTFFALKSVESHDALGIKAAIRKSFVEVNLENA